MSNPLLAFETSAPFASIALFLGDRCVAEHTHADAARGESLLLHLDELLVRAGIPLSQLKSLAVGLGPGSFTGVRTGIAAAKGLAIGRGIPLLGVGSLDAMLAAHAVATPWIAALIDARRGETYFTLRRTDEPAPVIETTYGTATVIGTRLAAQALDGAVTVLGNVDDAVWSAFVAASALPPDRLVRIHATPHARDIARAVLRGEGTRDDGSLDAMYVRPCDAQVPTPRVHG